MTDKQWQKELNALTSAHSKYLKLLKKAEDEYLRRFGHYPSEVDDDFWIDSFSQSDSGAKVEDIIKHAKDR